MADGGMTILKEASSSLFSKMTGWKERLYMVVVLMVQLFAISTDTFLFPFFPQEALKRGLTDIHIGIVFSAFEFSRFVMSVTVGHLISGSTIKQWMIVGGVLTSVCCALLGLVNYISGSTLYLVLCIIIRLVAGIGSSILVVTATTLLFKITSFSNSFIVGAVEGVLTVGWIIGPALGAAIFQIAGYNGMFWILGSLLFLLNILQAFVIPKPDAEESREKGSIRIFNIPGIVVLFLHVFIYRTAISAVFSGASVFFSSTFGLSESMLGLFFGLWSAGYLLACPIVPLLINRGLIYSTMLFGWAASIPLYLLAGPSPLLEVFFGGQRYCAMSTVLLTLLTLMEGFLFLPSYQAAINLASANGHGKDSTQTYAAVTGTLNSAIALGAMVGPIYGNAITQASNYTWTLTSLAGLALLALTILSIYLLTMKICKLPLKPENSEENTKSEQEDTISNNNTEKSITSDLSLDTAQSTSTMEKDILS